MGLNTAPPSGTRDFLPDELAKRRFVEKAIRRVYESFGFVAIETPAMENLSTLLGKYGEEGDQLLFRILHRREKLSRAIQGSTIALKDLSDIGLRYDLTVPLARVMANAKNLPRFFKRYQIQPVWRADHPGKGRYREFLQCDVDITGTDSLVAEAEVCTAVAMVFEELGFREFSIHLNHRRLLNCIIRAAGLPPDQEETALVAVDKMDKVGEEGVRKDLAQRGISTVAADALLCFIRRPGDLSEIGELDRMAALLENFPEAAAPLAELRELIEILSGTSICKYVRIDATLARGLGYYTGPIFEVRTPSQSGSLGGGGRYDGLIGMFKGTPIPAVGFSIGFERLILIMEDRKLFGTLSLGPDLLLCRFPDVKAADALRTAEFLRVQGLKVEVFPETPKIGKQLAYAESIKVPIAAILGGSEFQDGKLSIKNLATSEQLTMPVSEAATRIGEWLENTERKGIRN